MIRIVFVCTGNTCRSPMAEAILKGKLEKIGVADCVNVSSAGISAWEGQPASPEAMGVLFHRKILSIGAHRSQQVRAKHLSEADLILTMTRAHKERLERLFADCAGKIALLSEYAGSTGDVADPIGGSLNEYQLCADELDRWIEASLGKILTLAGKL